MPLTNYPNGVMSAGMPFGMMGVGNVYNVIDGDEAFYNDFHRNRKTTYSDGSVNLHKTIASALAATVECRNDYVVVWPKNSDYDLTSALAMNKKAVHLVCPAGMGYEIGANNACRIEQTTDGTAIIAVSDAAVEIAGFYLKPYYGQSHITLAAGSYAPNIHHNYLPLKWDNSSDKPAIAGTGDACGWGNIEKNYLISQAGGSDTCAVVLQIASSATGANVSYNQLTIGDTQIATVGFQNHAVKGNTNFNIFSEAGGDGVTDGGTITNAISIHASGCAIGNRGAVGNGHLLVGGTASHSFCDNLDAEAYYSAILET